MSPREQLPDWTAATTPTTLFQRGIALLEDGRLRRRPPCRSREAATLEPDKTSIREALGRAYFRNRPLRGGGDRVRGGRRAPSGQRLRALLPRPLAAAAGQTRSRRAATSRWPRPAAGPRATTASTASGSPPRSRLEGRSSSGSARPRSTSTGERVAADRPGPARPARGRRGDGRRAGRPARRQGARAADLRRRRGRMNEPLGDRETLCVSQFTLYGDTRKGNRPSYVDAAPARRPSRCTSASASARAKRGRVRRPHGGRARQRRAR